MLLRRSGAEQDTEYNLGTITGADDTTIGVPDEDMLIEIADAVVGADPDQLADIRQRGSERLGPQALTDAIAVACGFNGITKVANATGIPLDDRTEEITGELRAVTGIDDYAEAHKSALFD